MICFLRTIMVLLAWGFAKGVPRFEICLALVGGFATSILAFILPPLFHLALARKSTSRQRNALHVVILVCGIGATIVATGVNLWQSIVHNSEPSTCGRVQYSCTPHN